MRTGSRPSSRSGTYSRSWLEPTLGPLRLDEIDLGAVNALRAELLTRRGRTGLLSAKTRANILATLSTAMRYAEDVGVIERAPRIKVKNPPPPPIEVLDFDELGRMVGAALHHGEPWGTAVLLVADCGLRVGEMLALEWRDLDLVAGHHHGRAAPAARRRRRPEVGQAAHGADDSAARRLTSASSRASAPAAWSPTTQASP